MTHISSQFDSCSNLGDGRAARGRNRGSWLALALCAAVLAAASNAPAEAPAVSPAARSTPPPSAMPAASTPALRQLWDAEQTWVRALTTSSPALLEQLVDSELSFIGPDGEYEDRDAYLAGYRALASQGIRVLGIDLYDVKMRDLGQTGLVTGRVIARVQMGEQTIVENVRFTRVYARRGQSWRMVAGQGTRLAPAPSPS
jgi:hypothetical protein